MSQKVASPVSIPTEAAPRAAAPCLHDRLDVPRPRPLTCRGGSQGGRRGRVRRGDPRQGTRASQRVGACWRPAPRCRAAACTGLPPPKPTPPHASGKAAFVARERRVCVRAEGPRALSARGGRGLCCAAGPRAAAPALPALLRTAAPRIPQPHAGEPYVPRAACVSEWGAVGRVRRGGGAGRRARGRRESQHTRFTQRRVAGARAPWSGSAAPRFGAHFALRGF